MTTDDSTLSILLSSALGEARARELLDTLEIDARLLGKGMNVSRAVFAMALNAVLFADLLKRVPTGAAYVADVRAAGGKVCFDHGALRTVKLPNGPTGELPPGEQAFTRILDRLGYVCGGVYPLDRLRMTGRAYAHAELPAALPQFFVSELEVDRFPDDFQAVAQRVFGSAREPLRMAATTALRVFGASGWAPFSIAAAALPQVAAAFGRSHALPTLDDYNALLAHSPEAAWIATEGQAFNHATDRVPDVHAVADAQRALGRPIKDAVEVSRAGTVRQTAFRADPVVREMTSGKGLVRRSVPGSFYEFISRDEVTDETGARRLDLRFDSGNAQGIFKMTEAA